MGLDDRTAALLSRTDISAGTEETPIRDIIFFFT